MLLKTEELAKKFANSDPGETLAWFAGEYPGKMAFSTSLSAEDQVVTHLLVTNRINAGIFTLDTGRLFQETYDLLDLTRKKYSVEINVYFPDASQVEKMVDEKGINLFYDSIGNRKECCHIRKIVPLQRALAGMMVWVTGLRKEQSVTRKGSKVVEWDAALRIFKVNPLIRWTNDEVWNYIREYNIPVSELHARGYPSIGCQPCTRPVNQGEDLRAGRWWWESANNKECGIHKK